MSAFKAARVGEVNHFYKACHEQYDAQRADGMDQREAPAILRATLENFEMNVKRVESSPVMAAKRTPAPAAKVSMSDAPPRCDLH